MELNAQLRSDGFAVVPGIERDHETAGRFDWAHRGPFDRIAVTAALKRGRLIVSKGNTLSTLLGGGLRRVS